MLTIVLIFEDLYKDSTADCNVALNCPGYKLFFAISALMDFVGMSAVTPKFHD